MRKTHALIGIAELYFYLR